MARTLEFSPVGPPHPTKPDVLNADPSAFWRDAVTTGNIMGTIVHKGKPTFWKVLFPIGQDVPEVDSFESFHMMVAPYAPTRHMGLGDLDMEKMEPLANFMNGFLDRYPLGRAGYNIGADLSRKTVQNWHNFHAHLIHFSPDSADRVLQSRPFDKHSHRELHRLREPMWARVDELTTWWFRREVEKLKGVSSVGVVRWGLDGQYPKGGTTFRLKDDITSLQLAHTFKAVDNSFTQLHREVFSLFASNYDEAAASNGLVPYALRNQEDILAGIDAFHLGDPGIPLIRRVLPSFAKVFKPADNVPDNLRVITSPTYSVTMLKNGEGASSERLLTVTPILLSDGGGYAAEGYTLRKKYKEGYPVVQRRERADEALQRMHDDGIVEIDELIEASSLGTPAAKRLRESTPQRVVDQITARMEELVEHPDEE